MPPLTAAMPPASWTASLLEAEFWQRVRMALSTMGIAFDAVSSCRSCRSCTSRLHGVWGSGERNRAVSGRTRTRLPGRYA